MVYVTSQPTTVRAKSKIQSQREYGVFAQVANETCTFDRYVSLSVLFHISSCFREKQ